ncbi:hypothetical protein BHM03_00046493 [Ensete ventricosum]|nr:hypothetical protein BHM03_00046493 [Ensete ventricosum]
MRPYAHGLLTSGPIRVLRRLLDRYPMIQVRKGGGRPSLGPLQGRLTTATPLAGVVGHGQPPCRGERLRPRLWGQSLAKGGYAARGAPARASHSNQPARGCRLRPALLPVGARRRPQGWSSLSRAAADRKGSPPLA